MQKSKPGKAFFRSFRADYGSRFFFEESQRPNLVATGRKHCRGEVKQIVAAADRICEHVFDFVGSGPVQLGEKIDWHRDYRTGFRWPRRRLPEALAVPVPVGTDCLFPWKLNTFLHFPILGKSYGYTGNEKYAREFVGQTTDWLQDNPPYKGVNWEPAMTAALRLCNWIWCFHFFRSSPSVDDRFWERFIESIYRHADYVRNHLEWLELRNNHYVSNIYGLVFAGAFFRDLPAGREWFEFGCDQLCKEMDFEINPDGTFYEGSTAYHGFVTEMFLHATLLARINGHRFPTRYMKRLERMIRFVMEMTKKDGQVCLIGDNDDGWFPRLGRETIYDFRHLTAVGAALFRNGEFKQRAGRLSEAAIWLMGVQGMRKYVTVHATRRPPGSVSFPDGGYHVLRHRRDTMTVRCGELSMRSCGGHGNNDQLSFELALDDEPLIVDPGIYIYREFPGERERFHSTAYHNTLMVDRMEQKGGAWWPFQKFPSPDPTPRLLDFRQEGNTEILVGEHRLYHKLKHPVTHVRRFIFYKDRRQWEIEDIVEGSHTHLLEWHFHFAAGTDVTRQGRQLNFSGQHARGVLNVAGCRGLSMSVKKGWVSPAYGVRERALIGCVKCETLLPVMVRFTLSAA